VTQYLKNTLGSLPVTIWGATLSHLLVGSWVVQEPGCFTDNACWIGADNFEHPRSDSLGALGDLPQHQHGFAKRWGFFLNTSGVGKDNLSSGHEMYEVRIGYRFQQVYSCDALQRIVHDGANIGVRVNRKGDYHFRELFSDLT
jgi:hypothetical protein